MDSKPITGVIQTSAVPVTFFAEPNDYTFWFMCNTISSSQQFSSSISIPTTDGFIHGKTHNNKDIAIYLGRPSLDMGNPHMLNTSAYIQSYSPFQDMTSMDFDTITFYGGTLNTLFYINGMHVDYSSDSPTLKYADDSLKWNVELSDFTIDITINSTLSEIHEGFGVSLNNTQVVLSLKFSKLQKLKSLWDHYNHILDLLSFMTFRQNVGFDRITLSQNKSNADVFIKNDSYYATSIPSHNIYFNDLTENLPNLIKLFYGKENGDPLISLNIIPTDDKDRYKITSNKIRSLCTTLEFELSFTNAPNEMQNILLENLIESTREHIKIFRSENPILSNDVYNLIFSNIKHWTFPLAEKLIALYHVYEQEILTYSHSSSPLMDTDIREFVKCRNNLTHGNHQHLSPNILNTVEHMYCLVYCCILCRIEIPKEKLLDLFKNKFL